MRVRLQRCPGLVPAVVHMATGVNLQPDSGRVSERRQLGKLNSAGKIWCHQIREAVRYENPHARIEGKDLLQGIDRLGRIGRIAPVPAAVGLGGQQFVVALRAPAKASIQLKHGAGERSGKADGKRVGKARSTRPG